MGGTPEVSFLLPVFNCGPFLRAAIESILAQTQRDWEMVIVNDGSVDDSGFIIDEFSRRDPRIIVLHQENQGLPKALNRGLGICRGRLIARMDGDDIAVPGRLQTQLEFLGTHREVGLVGSAVEVIDPVGRRLGRGNPPLDHDAIDGELMKGNGSAIYHPTVLVRREVIESVGGYDESSGLEDLDLFLRLAEITRLANLPEPLLDYRLHLGSTNANRRERHALMTDEVVLRAHVRRGLDPATAPRRRVLESSKGAVYEDWSMKASLSGHYRTALIHAGNAFMHESGTRRWARLARSMRFFGSRIIRVKLLGGSVGNDRGET